MDQGNANKLISSILKLPLHTNNKEYMKILQKLIKFLLIHLSLERFLPNAMVPNWGDISIVMWNTKYSRGGEIKNSIILF